MVTTVEELVEEELVEAYKIMCTDPQLKCGVLCEEHCRRKFAVDFSYPKFCPHQIYEEKGGLGALFSVRQVLAAAAETLRQKVAWFKQNFPEDEEDPADGLPSVSIGVKIPNRRSWQDVCTSEDADGSAAKPSSRAQFYAFVNPGVLKHEAIHVKIELLETLRRFKKRRTPAVETAEKGEERPTKKTPKSAKLVDTCRDASSGDTVLKEKAFKAMADLYMDADVRKSYESRLGKLHQRFDELLMRIEQPEFRKRFPLVVRWDSFPKMGVFGASKDWINAEQEGKTVISFSVFSSPAAFSLCMCVCALSLSVCVCVRALCVCVCARALSLSVCVCACFCVCVCGRALSLYVCVRTLSLCMCVCALSLCVCTRALSLSVCVCARALCVCVCFGHLKLHVHRKRAKASCWKSFSDAWKTT
jgi:hypothetical protein